MSQQAPAPTPILYERLAGAAYLVIIIVAVLYGGLVESKLVVSGDDAATAANIIAHEGLFRLGILLMLVIYTAVIVASWALYLLLKPVDANLSLLGLLFRGAEAVLGAVTVLPGFVALQLLTDGTAERAFEPQQIEALAGHILALRVTGLDVVLVLIGIGATLFCYLLLRSRFIPRILAAWGIVTYVSMLFLGIVSILFPQHPPLLETILYGAGSAFELTFGFWLLFKGIDLEQWRSYAPPPATS